jgi:hypothetical protein
MRITRTQYQLVCNSAGGLVEETIDRDAEGPETQDTLHRAASAVSGVILMLCQNQHTKLLVATVLQGTRSP